MSNAKEANAKEANAQKDKTNAAYRADRSEWKTVEEDVHTKTYEQYCTEFNEAESVGGNPNPHKMLEDLKNVSDFVCIVMLDELNTARYKQYRPLSEDEHQTMIKFLKGIEGTEEYETAMSFLDFWNNAKAVVRASLHKSQAKLSNYFCAIQATLKFMMIAENNAKLYGTDDPFYKESGITQSETHPIDTLYQLYDQFNDEFFVLFTYGLYMDALGGSFGLRSMYGLFVDVFDQCYEMFLELRKIKRLEVDYLYGDHHTPEESRSLEREIKDIAYYLTIPKLENEDIYSAFDAVQGMGPMNCNQIFAFSAILKNIEDKKKADNEILKRARRDARRRGVDIYDGKIDFDAGFNTGEADFDEKSPDIF